MGVSTKATLAFAFGFGFTSGSVETGGFGSVDAGVCFVGDAGGFFSGAAIRDFWLFQECLLISGCDFQNLRIVAVVRLC
jgi:hypothetical protein